MLPVYENEEQFKGPQLYGPNGNRIAPDMLVVSTVGKACWIEAKHKTRFTWHRITKRWTTGIDLHYYSEYVKIATEIDWPVWLLFLHIESEPWASDIESGCPAQCPIGLFGGNLLTLKGRENHRHDNHGKSGMVYWNYEILTKLADVSEL